MLICDLQFGRQIAGLVCCQHAFIDMTILRDWVEGSRSGSWIEFKEQIRGLVQYQFDRKYQKNVRYDDLITSWPLQFIHARIMHDLVCRKVASVRKEKLRQILDGEHFQKLMFLRHFIIIFFICGELLISSVILIYTMKKSNSKLHQNQLKI